VALFGRKKKRTLVIGLDGVPHSLISRFAADGTMPYISRLAGLGHLAKMKVTLPEISAVSWPSFMTGTNPGTHGIFGFVDPKPGSYDYRFPNFRDLKAPTIWDRLGQKKKRSVVINQPSTYPAREIPGVLISGFVAISLKKAVWPLHIVSDLESINYKIDIDTARAREDHEYLIDDLGHTLTSRLRVIDHFWKKDDWDYFQVVAPVPRRVHRLLPEGRRVRRRARDPVRRGLGTRRRGGGDLPPLGPRVLRDRGRGPRQRVAPRERVPQLREGRADVARGHRRRVEGVRVRPRADLPEPQGPLPEGERRRRLRARGHGRDQGRPRRISFRSGTTGST